MEGMIFDAFFHTGRQPAPPPPRRHNPKHTPSLLGARACVPTVHSGQHLRGKSRHRTHVPQGGAGQDGALKKARGLERAQCAPPTPPYSGPMGTYADP